MTYRLLVSDGDTQWFCEAWNNFVSEDRPDDPYISGTRVMGYLDRHLEQWHGKVMITNYNTYIEFSSQEQAVLWILRWS